MKNTVKIVTTFNYRGHKYTIAHDGKFYLAIEDKYITNGKMNTTLNGLQMNASDTLNQCLTGIKNRLDMEHYEAQGMSKAEAFCKVFNMPNMVGQMEKVFNEAH